MEVGIRIIEDLKPIIKMRRVQKNRYKVSSWINRIFNEHVRRNFTGHTKQAVVCVRIEVSI